jgi:branched-chain amino acid transport system permease protein
MAHAVLAFAWPELAQQVVSGLATGSIYASLALALVIVYRSTGVVNFAQGEMATLSTYVALSLDRRLPLWLAVVLALCASFAGGVVVERVVIRPVERAPALTVVMVTLGGLILVNGIVTWIWGGQTRAFPSVFSTRPIRVGGVAFSIQDLGFVGLSVAVVLVLYAFFRLTATGLALRAAALDPDASGLLGVRVGWMLALGWGIAAALGALAGIMTAPTTQLDPNMMQGVLLYALAAAVLGGLDSPAGAVVGGLSLGVVLNLLGRYVALLGGEMRLTGGLAVILVVLLVKPTGLFGSVAARRV